MEKADIQITLKHNKFAKENLKKLEHLVYHVMELLQKPNKN